MPLIREYDIRDSERELMLETSVWPDSLCMVRNKT